MAGETKKKNPLGESGITVADNIKRLRTGRGLTFTEVADRLASVGRPIPTLGLRKIESYERRVDADDLIALAIVLDVAPVTLLMPAVEDQGEPVSVTGLQKAQAVEVWDWLRGKAARPGAGRMNIETWPAWEQMALLVAYTDTPTAVAAFTPENFEKLLRGHDGID